MQIVHVPTAGKTIEGVLEFAIKITEKIQKSYMKLPIYD